MEAGQSVEDCAFRDSSERIPCPSVSAVHEIPAEALAENVTDQAYSGGWLRLWIVM